MSVRSTRLGCAVLLFALVSACETAPTAPSSCRSSRECSGAGLVCDTVSMVCVECVSDLDCLADDTICAANECRAVVSCVSSRECPGLVCNTTLGYCVECVADVDCPDGQACDSSTCVTPPTPCTSDRTCSGMAQVCDLARGYCVDCVRDADCAAGTVCMRSSCVSAGDGGTPPATDQIDLLLMIDNSNSMTEEQASVVAEIPRLVEILSSGDRDGDGTRDFVPASSVHIGIVDSDMGVGDVTGVASCSAGVGDDGLLQTRPRQPGPGCLADYSSLYPEDVFTFSAGSGITAATFAMDVGCVASLGTNGCGFEHQLEAPLKALSLTPTSSGDSPVAWTAPGYVPPVFYGGTTGHGDDPSTNGAFLRASSVLAIVAVTDEDDCSTPHPEIFSPTDPRFVSIDLNLRCHELGTGAGSDDQLYPVQRYVDGFAGLRASPSRLVYAAIAGVPPELAGMEPSVILGDTRMTEQVDPERRTMLAPVCTSPGGRGVAYPAVRITRLAAGLSALGAHTTVQSICNGDFGGAFDVIIDALADAL